MYRKFVADDGMVQTEYLFPLAWATAFPYPSVDIVLRGHIYVCA